MQVAKQTATRSTASTEIERLGQVRVSSVRDFRLEKRYDRTGKILYAVMEFHFYEDAGMSYVTSTEAFVGTYEELVSVLDMFGAVLDDIESNDGRNLPVVLTDRFGLGKQK